MKKLVLLLLVVSSACAGQKDKNGIPISVKIEKPEVGLVKLELLTADGLKTIDSVNTTAENGKLDLRANVTKPEFLRLNIYGRQMVNVILKGDEKQINITAEGSMAGGKSNVTGSPDTRLMIAMDSLAKKRQSDVQLLNNEAMQANSQGNTAIIAEIREQYFYLMVKHNQSLKKMIWAAVPSIASLYGLNYINVEEDFGFVDSLATEFRQVLPEHPFTVQLVERLDGMRKLAIGSPAPEISLPDPNGNIVSLSSLKGKYVLIDFWAAWCRPCREENPNVVRLYDQYGGDQFEILGVSLDRTKEAWVKAIADDKLNWKHISDLQYFNSVAAREYQIGAIPATYLIGPSGEIVAKNLRGESLRAKLAELFD